MSLRKAATSGLIWTFLDTVLGRGVGILSSLVLARFLLPKDFGLMGMIYIFTSVAAALVDSGLTTSLVRTRDAKNIDFSTIFFTNVVFSFVLYLIVFICAPFISSFYGETSLIIIIRVYSLLFVIDSFSAVQSSLFTRQMDFKRLMLMNIPGIVLGAITGITMALMNYGVWSIVFMQLVTHSVLAISLWSVSSWKPSWLFSFNCLKGHFNFGYRLTISGLLNSVFNNIYNIIIGKYFTTQILGQYDRAKVFNDYPVIILTSMINKVTYPLLSGITNEDERLQMAYKQILQFAFFVSAPLMLVLSIISKPLIIIALGDQWEQAADFFKILCFAGLLYPIHAFNLNLLKVYGRTDWYLKLEFIKKGIIVLVISATFSFGVYWLVWGSVIISVLSLVVNTHYTNKLIKYSLITQIKDMRFTILNSTLMYGLMILIINFFDLLPLYQIIIPSCFGFLFYLGMSYLLKSPSLALLLQMKNNFVL